jgi:outer membrane lipoprotein-sorting protein
MSAFLRTFGFVLGILLPSHGAAAGQTIDEIVAKYLQARGGIDRLKAMNTVKITGTVTSQGAEMSVSSWAKRPNLFRRETRMQGARVVLASDGNTVWGINPLAGIEAAQEITGAPAERMRAEAEFDPVFLDYRQKGHTIDLVGEEKLDGKAVYHLKVSRAGGDVQHFFLDSESGLELRRLMTLQQGAMRADIATDLSDYREINGVTIPFAMTQSRNGNVVERVKVEKVEINVPIEDDLFRMPK